MPACPYGIRTRWTAHYTCIFCSHYIHKQFIQISTVSNVDHGKQARFLTSQFTPENRCIEIVITRSPTSVFVSVRHVTSPIDLTEILAECSNSSSSDDDYIPHSPVRETGSSSSNDILSEPLDKETDKYEDCISARTATILKQKGLYETLHDSHHPVFAEFHSHMEKKSNKLQCVFFSYEK